MLWVTWRHNRVALLSVIMLTALIVAAFLAIGIDARSQLETPASALSQCAGASSSSCQPAAIDSIVDRYKYLDTLRIIMLIFPLLVGSLLGAPLVAREHEQGTNLYTLTQSSSRLTWWWSKITVVGVPALIASLILGLTATWAARPLELLRPNELTTPNIQTQGVLIGGYLAISFAISLTAGAILKNTVAAIAVTVVVYLGISLIASGNRSNYLPTESLRIDVVDGVEASADVPDGSWIVEDRFLDERGAEVGQPYGSCPAGSDEAACFSSEVRAESIQFHPASRFWAFQMIETAVLLFMSAIVLEIGRRTVRRSGL